MVRKPILSPRNVLPVLSLFRDFVFIILQIITIHPMFRFSMPLTSNNNMIGFGPVSLLEYEWLDNVKVFMVCFQDIFKCSSFVIASFIDFYNGISLHCVTTVSTEN